MSKNNSTPPNSNIRVKLCFAEADIPKVLIPGLHHIPRAGDWIDAESIVDESLYTDEQLDVIWNNKWSVWFVTWSKDDEGFFVLVTCEKLQ